MFELLLRLLKLLPKQWQPKALYVLTFAVLLVLELLSQLEKAVLHLIRIMQRQKVIAATGMAALVILTVAGLALVMHSPGSDAEVIAYSSDTPSEVKPDENYAWPGRPEDPKKIIIPSIESEGFIQKVGVDQNQQITVPNNIHMAGWFADSAVPGQPGLGIIDGHVDGRSNQGGIFKRLAELKEGDEFKVELGDGSVLGYQLRAVTSVPTDQAAAVLFSQNPKIKSQLNLITCGGNYDRQAHEYDQRVIISAELVMTD